MSNLLQFVIIGIASGAVYGLFSLGIVLVNNSTRILDFGQGEIGGVAAFLVGSLSYQHGLSLWLSIPAALAVGGSVGWLAWFFLVRPGGNATLPPLVGTVALISFLVIVEDKVGGASQHFPSPIEARFDHWGFSIPYLRFVVLAVVALACAALWLLLYRTSLGLQLRAGADNRRGAALIGLRPRRSEAVAWSIAGTLAAGAAILLGWIQGDVGPGFATIALPSIFAAAIIGGMSSLPGCLVGGVVVGVAESLTRDWFGQVPGSPQLVVFLLIGLTLFLRPQGLFGKRATGLAAEGVESLVDLHPVLTVPRAQRRPERWILPTLVLVVALAGVALLSSPLAYKLSILPIFAVLALSLNFLITTTGQLSLSHVGFLGLGAFMTAVSAATWDLPAPLALVVGALSTAAVAAVVGVAALRVRGLYLAVLTFALGYVFQEFLFPRSFFSNGGAGISLDRPSLLGVDLADERAFLGLCVVTLAAVWAFDRLMLASPLGRALVGLRDNPVASTARGISTRALPVLAFVLSGLLAGIAGGLFGYRLGLVTGTSFNALGSLAFVIYVVIGGIAARAGVVAVTSLFVAVATFNPSWLQGDVFLLVGSLGVVISIGAHPEGIGGQIRSLVRSRFPSATRVIEPAPRVIGTQHRQRVQTGTVLAARGITVQFAGLRALHDVSLHVDAQEVVAVIGPNGAGKTTLFNTLSGFVTPAAGSVALGSHVVDALPPAERARRGLGRTFQQGGLCLSETALSNLLIAQHQSVDSSRLGTALGVGRQSRRAEQRRVALAEQVLSVLRLPDIVDIPVRDLPYGVRKTLEIGCALVTGPRVLLLDEPAAGASQQEAAQLADVIRGIRDELGVSVLVIEHHVPLVRGVADRVYVLSFGELLAHGSPDAVTSDPAVREAYLGTAAVEGALR